MTFVLILCSNGRLYCFFLMSRAGISMIDVCAFKVTWPPNELVWRTQKVTKSRARNPQKSLVCLDFLKVKWIYIFIFQNANLYRNSRFSRHCADLLYWLENLNKFSKFLYRYAFWRKWHTWENLDGQKLFGVSVSGSLKP